MGSFMVMFFQGLGRFGGPTSNGSLEQSGNAIPPCEAHSQRHALCFLVDRQLTRCCGFGALGWVAAMEHQGDAGR